MKVYLGPYKRWTNPWRVAEKIPFISEDTQEKIGDWLSEQKAVTTTIDWINNLKGDRKINIHIDEWDDWSADHTMSLIIVPLLKQIRDNKRGYQLVDLEDVPQWMRHKVGTDCSQSEIDEDDWRHSDFWAEHRWQWVLDQMIFAHENVINDDWQLKFHHGEIEYQYNLVSGEEGTESALYEAKQVNPDYWFDKEGYDDYNQRIENGLRLFGKYYRGLWT